MQNNNGLNQNEIHGQKRIWGTKMFKKKKIIQRSLKILHILQKPNASPTAVPYYYLASSTEVVWRTRKLHCWSAWLSQSHPHKAVVSASAAASLTVCLSAECTDSVKHNITCCCITNVHWKSTDVFNHIRSCYSGSYIQYSTTWVTLLSTRA